MPFTNSPPGKLTDVNGNIASRVEFISTLHRLVSTAVIRPTTTSPTSPIYLFLIPHEGWISVDT
ncbi:hypothetical protein BpHYR1_024627 [Brachionus plicatilis]|uniref:Uncharacterized protein n=1 Tax=Brachionus plicatilis TaxID=10195 RepID=A0A3M7SR62_BRAPC|nr:hypothetical protein BpHYR1_024627 [Brachionus plicatilis]